MDHDRAVVNRGEKVRGGGIFLEIESFFRQQPHQAKSSESVVAGGLPWRGARENALVMVLFCEPAGSEMCLPWQRRNVAFEAFEFSSGLIAESSGSVQTAVCVIFLVWKFQQNWPTA